jgi:predicted metal-dependent phosphoesterase TrpH
VSSRHAPPAEGDRDDEPFIPGDAVADLHAHTLRSDGVLEPAELIRQAYAAGVRLLAISDHDNLAAFREVTAPGGTPLPPDLELVPAVEINAVTRGLDIALPEGELHVLGIGVDTRDEAFEAALASQRGARRARFETTRTRLRELGVPIDAYLDPAALTRDDAIGRPTVARALVAAGHAESVEDAFERWLSWGQLAYVPRSGLGPIEAIRAIRAAGGLASLAHFPWAPDRISLMRTLIGEGLDGLETNHRSFTPEQREGMGGVASALGLVATGGTDYHGDLGDYAGAHAGLVMPDELVAGVRAALSSRGWPARP